jgi:hypothetical protein
VFAKDMRQEMKCVNGPTRKRLYSLIVQRDGACCKKCGASARQRQLVLDHINNNNKDNRPENLQLLCRRCNYLKNPRRPVDSCVSEHAESEQTVLSINKLKEPMFRKYVIHRVNEENAVPESDLLNAGAETIGMSPVTAKRHLGKMCSSAGNFERARIGDTVVIRYKTDIEFT